MEADTCRALLVTGGCGFIGSHFVRRLLRAHAELEVVNLDALTYAGNPANLADVADDPRYRFVHGDIADADAVAEAGRGLRRDRQLRGRDARRPLDPRGRRRSSRPNVLGTQCLLEHVARAGGRASCTSRPTRSTATSSRGDRSREGDALPARQPVRGQQGRRRPAGARLRAHLRRRRVITRGSNNYGPYQFPEKLIPLFTTNAARRQAAAGLRRRPAGARLHLRRRPLRRRSSSCSRAGAAGEIYNVGGGNEVQNIETDAPLLDADRPRRDADPPRRRTGPGTTGATRSTARSCARSAGRRRSTSPRASRATVEWYRDNRAWWEPIKYGGGFAEYREQQYGGRTG